MINRNLLANVKRFLLLAISIAGFLLSLEVMSDAFKLLSNETINSIISATANPFIGLFIGLLSTAILQSSSTTTSMVVVMVASGTLTLQNAVPIIMGANIGTTVTSSFVALAHITRKKEFRRAIAAATIHDFFNIITVLVLLPVELLTGVLSSSALLASKFVYSLDLNPTSGSSFGLGSVTTFISAGLYHSPYLLLFFSLFTLFLCIKSFTYTLKQLLIGNSLKRMQEVAFGSPLKALGVGTIFTAVIQSSSVTSSLLVPLVATNKVSIKRAFPFLMGANVGTTFTALLAAISKSEAAISIAVVHLLFNLLGVLLLYPVPAIRNLPIIMALQLGKATIKNRLTGFLYIMMTFFVVPFFLIYFSTQTPEVATKAAKTAGEEQKMIMPEKSRDKAAVKPD